MDVLQNFISISTENSFKRHNCILALLALKEEGGVLGIEFVQLFYPCSELF